jgi:hypothetical protein
MRIVKEFTLESKVFDRPTIAKHAGRHKESSDDDGIVRSIGPTPEALARFERDELKDAVLVRRTGPTSYVVVYDFTPQKPNG